MGCKLRNAMAILWLVGNLRQIGSLECYVGTGLGIKDIPIETQGELSLDSISLSSCSMFLLCWPGWFADCLVNFKTSGPQEEGIKEGCTNEV